LYFFQFRFADKVDILLMIIATICSMAHGTALPLLLLVFGDMTEKFVSSEPSTYVYISTPELVFLRSLAAFAVLRALHTLQTDCEVSYSMQGRFRRRELR
jgi:hypothetical protein